MTGCLRKKVEDARAFLRTPRRKYDLIVHDTFTGGATPDHLLSLEVVNDIRTALKPDGARALNFVGYQRGPSVEASWLIARTLRAAFKDVRVFRDRPQETKPDIAVNLIFVASDGELSFTIPPRAEFHNVECERIVRSFQSWEIFKEVPPGAVVTDARNPLSRLQLAAAEEHFEAMQTILPRELCGFPIDSLLDAQEESVRFHQCEPRGGLAPGDSVSGARAVARSPCRARAVEPPRATHA